MNQNGDIFTEDKLRLIFPENRTNDFFEALFGGAEEGSYSIELGYVGEDDGVLDFELRLLQRPGKCLACNLTYGLPQVFSRHPIINVQGVAEEVAEAVGRRAVSWQLGKTQEVSDKLHVIPLKVELG